MDKKKTKFKENKHKVLQQNKLIKWGLLGLVLIIVMVSIYYFDLHESNKLNIQNRETGGATNNQNDKEKYTNRLYGYSIEYPSFLNQVVLTGEGGYLEFLRLESQLGSEEPGYAVGINESDLESETKRTKEIFSSDPNAKLASEEDIKVKDLPAKKLFYTPEDNSLGEERVVILVNKNKYTYSLSAVPSQIENLIENFEIFDIIPLGTMSE